MIGKPFVNTISESARASQIIRDIASNRNLLPNTQDTSSADDFYNVVQASYDSYLIDKGICSSTPVTIAAIPFTKLTQDNNAEADILNIQRNLDTIAISNVNEVINNLTGSLSPNVNASLDDRSQIDAFRAAVTKMTAAYNAKAAYMTHLASPYDLETNSDFSSDYSPGGAATGGSRSGDTIYVSSGIPSEITTTKITSFEEKLDWIEAYLKLESATLRSGYNIKNILQIVRNSFARKVYGSNFFVTGSSASLNVRSINVDAFNAALDSYFGNISNVYDSSLNISEENTDMLIAADAKSVSYTRAGVNFESEMSTLIGDLSSFTTEINLTRTTNAGVFTSLLQYQDGNKTVLPVDVNIGDQASLQAYESADEFFLGLPLNDNKENIPSRRDKFATNANQIESSTSASMSKMILQPDSELYSLNGFLSQMKTMMEESFYATNNTTSIMSFALLMTSLNDTQTRRRVFKIMMIRDRLINALDYVSSSEKSTFESKARSALELEVFNLIKYIVPEYADDSASDEDIVNSMNLSLSRTLNPNAYIDDNVPIEFSYNSNNAGKIILDDLVTGLNDTSSHQWDNFFKAARNIEAGSSNFLKSSPAASGSRTGSDVLFYKTGIATTLTKLSRDDRAFLFFNKWISIITNFTFRIIFVDTEYEVPSGEFGSSSSDYSRTARKVDVKAYYTTADYTNLKKSLSLTLNGFTTDQFTYYFDYVQPLARGILQDAQSFYDGIDYVYRFIMQASSLLNDASNLAYEYTPTYGENLSNHYTSNAILNLNRQSKLSFSREATYQNFSKDQYKSSNSLNGFLRFIQDDNEISEVQDSLVIICGIPYGMLDRLGAFNQNKIGYVDVAITLRPIGGSESGDIEITKSYPIGAYVEHQYLAYDSTINASYQQVLDATSLYELNANRSLVANDQFDESSKQNELQSTSLLNYIQLFYGLTFDYAITGQVTLDDITDTNTKTAIDSFKQKIYSYRFDELVESRYVSTGVNSLRFSRSNIITKALGGGVFDKIVAIPIDASLIKNESGAYLVDILVNISTRFEDRIEPVTTRTVVSPSSLLSNLQSALQSTLSQSITSVAATSSRFNVRGLN